MMPLTQNGHVTMSSREIAELVEKRHDNVKRTIETLAERGVIAFPQSEEKATAGRPVVEYQVGKRDSFVLVAQLSPEFTARLVDRWQELEGRAAAPQFAIPQTLSEALRLAADLSDKNAELSAKVAEQAPKVEALDRIATSGGSLCLRDSANNLQMRPIDLTRWMQANGWIYHRPGSVPWHGYQDKIQLGYLEHKVTLVSRSDGSEKVVEQVRVTPKGLARLAKAFRAEAGGAA
ncbi:DNA-binding protein [Cupriavidus sp. SK-3]|nr:DNA-binding protein [Cupriavidus sp. SK-3]